MFPGESDVMKVKAAFYDPFEYLMLRAREGKLKTDFRKMEMKLAYHAPCHLRVLHSRYGSELMRLIPGVAVQDLAISCSSP